MLLCLTATLSWGFSATVIKVSDGDTLLIKQNGGTKTKIRLYGIDSPEITQAYGKASASFTAKTVLNQKVNVKVIETDQYGRLVALITVVNTNINLNEQLVRQGYAWYYPQFCHNTTFCNTLKKLEQAARKQKLGLWQDSAPIPPWEFRKLASNNNIDDNGIKWLQVLKKILIELIDFIFQ